MTGTKSGKECMNESRLGLVLLLIVKQKASDFRNLSRNLSFPMCLFHFSDTNECLLANGGCETNCHNTNGSFYCSCATGFELYDELKCRGKMQGPLRIETNGACIHRKIFDFYKPAPNSQINPCRYFNCTLLQ